MIYGIYLEYIPKISYFNCFIMSMVVGVVMSQNLKDNEKENLYLSIKFYIFQVVIFILMILLRSLFKKLKPLVLTRFSFFQV